MAELIGRYSNVGQTSGEDYNWVDISNVIDQTSNTFASVEFDNEYVYESSDELYVYNNNIDTTRSDYIEKIEIAIEYRTVGEEGYTDFFGEIIPNKIFLVNGYNNYKPYTLSSIFIPLSSEKTTIFVDITDSGNAPGTGYWEWDDLDNLSVALSGLMIDSTDSFQIHVDDVYLKITTSDTPMPRYGLQCYDSTGNIILNSGDRISRVVFSTIAEAYQDGTAQIEIDIDSDRRYAFSIPINATNGEIQHSVSISGTTVSWTENHEDDTLGGHDYEVFGSCNSLIVVFGW